MIQKEGSSHESRRSVQFTPYPFLWGICLPQIIQSFPFIPNYFRASPGNQKSWIISGVFDHHMKNFRGSSHGRKPTSFSYPYPCKRGKGKEKERAGAMDAVGGAPHGHHRPIVHTLLHRPFNCGDVQ